jgi:hypothetical protein
VNIAFGSIPPYRRAVLGFAGAALSVLVFHQGMVALLYLLGMTGAPYSVAPVPPWGVPRIVDLCFWGGLYGIAFGLFLPRLSRRLWLDGLVLGVIAALVGMFIVAPLKGSPVGAGWNPVSWARSLLINGSWGIGVGLILPCLLRATDRRARLDRPEPVSSYPDARGTG